MTAKDVLHCLVRPCVYCYRRLKTIENSNTISRKSGRDRPREVVFHERFQYRTLTENIFVVLGRWSLMGVAYGKVVARGSSTVFGFWSA